MEQIAAIEFCVKLKKAATETSEMLKNSYDEEYLSRTSASECYKRFKEGRGSLQDDERKGRSSTPEKKNRRRSFKSVWPKIEL
jgi:hypothetical protein